MTENSIEQEIKKLCSHIKVVMGKLEALEEIDILIDALKKKQEILKFANF